MKKDNLKFYWGDEEVTEEEYNDLWALVELKEEYRGEEK